MPGSALEQRRCWRQRRLVRSAGGGAELRPPASHQHQTTVLPHLLHGILQRAPRLRPAARVPRRVQQEQIQVRRVQLSQALPARSGGGGSACRGVQGVEGVHCTDDVAQPPGTSSKPLRQRVSEPHRRLDRALSYPQLLVHSCRGGHNWSSSGRRAGGAAQCARKEVVQVGSSSASVAQMHAQLPSTLLVMNSSSRRSPLSATALRGREAQGRPAGRQQRWAPAANAAASTCLHAPYNHPPLPQHPC